MPKPAKRFRKRGRYEVVFVFDGGGSLQYTSPQRQSLSARETITALREMCHTIERAIDDAQTLKSR